MALTESSMVARGSPRGIAAERLLKVELAPSTTRPWKEMLRKSSPANWISSGLAFGRHKTGFDFFSRDRFSTINVCSSRPSLFFKKKQERWLPKAHRHMRAGRGAPERRGPHNGPRDDNRQGLGHASLRAPTRTRETHKGTSARTQMHRRTTSTSNLSTN